MTEVNVSIERTIVARGRIFNVVMERRIDLILMLPKWSYQLVELNGTGVRSYCSSETFLRKNLLWGAILTKIDGLVDEDYITQDDLDSE